MDYLPHKERLLQKSINVEFDLIRELFNRVSETRFKLVSYEYALETANLAMRFAGQVEASDDLRRQLEAENGESRAA